ncbi:MAG: hypothetical protein GY863_15065 [bacterium]|nr:hypothetical protein [bacterium]
MEIENIVKVITGLFLMATLIIAFIVRMKLGLTRATEAKEARKMRRNTLMIMVVVLIFLAYWIRIILSGRLAEEGIVGWKVYALLLLLFMGLSSLFFLLYGQFKKK